MSMKRITIERYQQPEPGTELSDDDFNLETNPGLFYAGCIEGETDDGNRWIMFIAHDGYPEMFWPQREPDGGVIGEGTHLIPDSASLTGKYRDLFEALKEEIGDGEPDATQLKQLGRLAYTDRTIYFRDEMDGKGNRTIFIVSRRNPTIQGSSASTGMAYWLYRKALDQAQG